MFIYFFPHIFWKLQSKKINSAKNDHWASSTSVAVRWVEAAGKPASKVRQKRNKHQKNIFFPPYLFPCDGENLNNGNWDAGGSVLVLRVVATTLNYGFFLHFKFQSECNMEVAVIFAHA